MSEFKRDPLSELDANRLETAATSAEERLVIFTLIDTGLRVAEFCSIRRDDVDFQRHRLRARGKRAPGAADVPRRWVPMTPRVAELVESWMAVRATIGFSPRTVQRIVKRVAVAGGVVGNCSPHVLRHTFACRYVLRGGSTRVLQLLLGHRNLAMTEAYLGMSGADVEGEFRRVIQGQR